MVLRPQSTQEVSRILAIAHDTNTVIVPHSGGTGLVGGQIPHGGEVLLSLDRMTRIITVDATDFTLTVEAGATLRSIQDAAEAAGPPVSLEPRFRRHLPHWRQSFHQCRGRQCAGLWQCAGPVPRP